MDDERPVDYEIVGKYKDVQEMLEEEYKKLSFFEKAVYQLQNHIFLVFFAGLLLGYGLQSLRLETYFQ